MQVLLIFDHRARKHYRPHLNQIVTDAGGTLREVDRNAGSIQIEAKFRKLTQVADVILIDLTAPNTNVGYEIGRFLRTGDHRLVFFSFSPPPPPFYLRGYNVYFLHEVIQNTETGELQARELREAIAEIGRRRPLEALGEQFGQSPAQGLLQDIRSSHDRVYRAPTAAFLFGEHAVTVGHPALHLPLPRYVFVAVKKSKRDISHLRFMRPNAATDEEADDLIEPFRARLHETLALLSMPPLDITVWSELPTMCGLGTSSAISACLALEVLGYSSAPDELLSSTNGGMLNVLASQETNRIFRTAWKIDAAFHTFRGSGAGVFGALAGTHGPVPNLFFSDPRRTWKADAGEFERNLSSPVEFPCTREGLMSAHSCIDEIRCVGFRGGVGSTAFQPGHFALVHSGHTKHTGFAVNSVAQMAKYFHFSGKMLQEILSGISDAGLTPRYPLSQRMSLDYIDNLKKHLQKDKACPDTTTEHEGAVQETLYAAYGCAALAGINSYWSGDDRFLSLMHTCQTVLEAMRLHEWKDLHGVAHYDLHHLANAINTLTDCLGDRCCAAKITGGGMGGDLIVHSTQRNAIAFEQALRQGILDAKCRCSIESPEFGRVHFSSTWVDGYPTAYKVKPAQLIQGEPPHHEAPIVNPDWQSAPS